MWGYCGIWSGSKLFPAPSSRGDERVVSVDEQVAGVGESSVGELCCVDCAGLRLDAEGVLGLIVDDPMVEIGFEGQRQCLGPDEARRSADPCEASVPAAGPRRDEGTGGQPLSSFS